MTQPANLRVNTQVPFPATVQGSGPVTVAKNAGKWVIGLAAQLLGVQNPPANPGADQVFVWDPIAQNFVLVPLSALTAPILDVFFCPGDSEIVGQAPGSGPNVQAGTVKVYVGSTGLLVDANDPVPSSLPAGASANTGSMWPAFGNAYYRATGRKVGLVIAGVGGSTQNSAADFGTGNWDLTGALYANAVAAFNAAVAAFTAAGFIVNFKGVIIALGSNDAIAIDNATINVGQYTASAVAMHARLRTTFANPELPIYYIQVGTNLTASDTGYAQVRAAQVGFAAPGGTDPFTYLAFINALDFLARSMLNAGAHYNQAGYNEVGNGLASTIIDANTEVSFQRSGLNLYWSQGNVAIGYPIATALLTVNPNVLPTGVGSSAPTPPLAPPAATPMHVIGLAGGTNVVVDAYGGPVNFQGRAIGGTIVVPTALPNATQIVALSGNGYTGAAFPAAVKGFFRLLSSELWTATANGVRAEVATTLNTTTTRTAVMGWENDGGITIPSNSANSKGAGTINMTGAIWTLTANLSPFTVGTLPAAGTAGRQAFVSNGRMYNGAGVLEGAGVGTGGLVTDNGTAWKVAGTNQTVLS